MATHTTRIVDLANLISKNTATLNEYLKVHSLPSPSFDVNAPKDLGIPADAMEIDTARKAALEASIELQDLLQGSISLLRPAVNGTSLQAIYKYDIASKVPIHGSTSFSELANLCELPELDLRRILRYAMVWHRCFCEPKEGFVAHTAASRLLVDDRRQYDMTGLSFDECWQSTARTVEALQTFKGREANETGHALAHDTKDNMFDWLGKNPAKAKRFTNAISTLVPSSRSPFILEAFDWASLETGTVIDVGGGSGGISILLAETFPSLNLVVQDLPEAIEGAADKLPTAIKSRIRFMAHDFFTDQPLVADVYMLRAVLHNWPDAYCVKILQKLLPSLRKGARILINEDIVPGPNTLPLLAERSLRAYDMLMMSLFNSREREEGDWTHLIQDADPRFRIVGARKPQEGTMGVIEVVWEG